MRRLLALLSTLTLIFTIGMVAALLIGRAQPTPLRVAMLHLTDCELPCWIGIVPGKTTLFEALARLRQVYGAFQITQIYESNPFFLSVEVLQPNQKALHLFNVDLIERHARSGPLTIELIRLIGFSEVNYGDFISITGSPSDVFLRRPVVDIAMPLISYKSGKIQGNFGRYVNSYSNCGGVFIDGLFTGLYLSSKEQSVDSISTDIEPQPWRGFRTCYR